MVDPRPLVLSGVVGRTLRGVSVSAADGEVLGVAGLVGSGKEELAAVLTGRAHPRSGTVTLAGRDHRPTDPPDSFRRGVALVPADRLNEGGIRTMTVTENITLSTSPCAIWRHLRVDRRAEARMAVAVSDDLG